MMNKYLHSFYTHLKTRDYRWKIKLSIILPICISLIALDIITKILAVKYLNADGVYHLWGNVIILRLMMNSGIAFGTSLQIGASVAIAVILIIISGIIALYINLLWISVGSIFILSGAFGNLISRAWNQGSVVDFFVWNISPPHTIFNFADVFVITGCALIGLGLVIELLSSYIARVKENKAEDLRIDKEQTKNRGLNEKNNS